MRLGWAVTTDHFSSPAPDASRTSAASRGPFYFAWGCFRDFVSGLRGVPRRGAALRPGHEIVSASRSRRIDTTPMHHALVAAADARGAAAEVRLMIRSRWLRSRGFDPGRAA